MDGPLLPKGRASPVLSLLPPRAAPGPRLVGFPLEEEQQKCGWVRCERKPAERHLRRPPPPSSYCLPVQQTEREPGPGRETPLHPGRQASVKNTRARVRLAHKHVTHVWFGRAKFLEMDDALTSNFGGSCWTADCSASAPSSASFAAFFFLRFFLAAAAVASSGGCAAVSFGCKRAQLKRRRSTSQEITRRSSREKARDVSASLPNAKPRQACHPMASSSPSLALQCHFVRRGRNVTERGKKKQHVPQVHFGDGTTATDHPQGFFRRLRSDVGPQSRRGRLLCGSAVVTLLGVGRNPGSSCDLLRQKDIKSPRRRKGICGTLPADAHLARESWSPRRAGVSRPSLCERARGRRPVAESPTFSPQTGPRRPERAIWSPSNLLLERGSKHPSVTFHK